MTDYPDKNENKKILIVEDDPNLGYILQEALELQHYSVTRCENGEEGYQTFMESKFSLCLIDVMLPVKDGFTLAKEIRQIDLDIPIIFLTAKSLKADRIEGFKIGGDDYITKPFSMEELLLRIQAVVKRAGYQHSDDARQQFTLGDYVFDYEQSLLAFKDQNRKLTHKESELLRLLCLHGNQFLDRKVALRHIWEDDSFFSARSMDVYITKLRKYLKHDQRIEIKNFHGKGFKMIVHQ
ncbi:response regulator transcription factor [candidate division KSB1 bacterium]|nr:response regulator transcription factor [candidate division KSB1 bacterium]